MCDFSNGFILCKCNDPGTVVHNKRSRKNRDQPQAIEYKWALYRSEALMEEELGRYLLPESDIGKGLTAERVLNALNSRNCFDFDYTPGEGHNLVISDPELRRMEFIFRNGEWVEDHYSPFDYDCVKIDSGKLARRDSV